MPTPSVYPFSGDILNNLPYVSRRELGVVYLPTDVSAIYAPQRIAIGTEESGDYTIVVLVVNPKNTILLVSLLSNDGNLVVQRDDDEVNVVNPVNAAWAPDPKYIICNEVEPGRIHICFTDLKKPYRFVVPFDVDDMFTDSFWEILYYLTQYQKFATFVSQYEIYENQLQMVAMNIPHDHISLHRHGAELKTAIRNGLQHHYTADFQMAEMHMITRSGLVTENRELEKELQHIKDSVDQLTVKNPTDRK